jgi:hypothetical protein
MVPSSTLVVFTDGECFSCGGFSRGKIVHYGRLEVITNCFGGLSFSPKGSDSDAALVSSIGDGPSSPLWTMKEDSTEEFHMVLSGDEGSAPPPLLPKDTTRCFRQLPSQSPRPLWPQQWSHCRHQLCGQMPTNLSSDGTLFRRGDKREPTPSNSTPSMRQCNNKTDSLLGKPPPLPSPMGRCGANSCTRGRRS